MIDLYRAVYVARIAMQFGQIRRVTLHPDGERESDTTHTVMLALLAIEFAPLVGVDPGLAAMFAVVHDLPEVYADDTNTARGLTPEQAAAKAEREAAAMERLNAEQGDASWFDLLRRYEVQAEPAARLVRYLDKVTPKLTHYLNRGAALRAMGLTAAEVHEKHATQGGQLAAQYPEMGPLHELFAEACGLVERGIASGEIVVAGEARR